MYVFVDIYRYMNLQIYIDIYNIHMYIYIYIYICICMCIFMSSINKKSIIERNFVLVVLKYFVST